MISGSERPATAKVGSAFHARGRVQADGHGDEQVQDDEGDQRHGGGSGSGTGKVRAL
jgi:hypothetical protein